MQKYLILTEYKTNFLFYFLTLPRIRSRVTGRGRIFSLSDKDEEEKTCFKVCDMDRNSFFRIFVG